MVFPAVRRACPAPQAQAILRLEAHLAPLVRGGSTVDPASQAAATAPQAHTALINAEVLSFVPRARTAPPSAVFLAIVFLEATVVSASQAAATAPQAHTALINAEVL